ncbi:OmpA family protein [Methylomonas rosea]|uniref:OmpA family protein n=1 Tax=Methylomonas rosea TaxID=2952227 RepID=A0ABT1TNT3_9GAMM|nr:OmpA family protein [Methylomonas sp. WSC-7]MCQ8116441.1 OmpA family protein [Methylomonas sp. WSC-7]
MKKPRSLDHDGLDGIIPSTDKARLKSGNPQGKSDKTLKKPMHSNVPWLLGVIGSLALLAVLVPDLTQKPEAITQTAALDKQAAPVKSPASTPLVASENTDTPAPKPPAEAAPTLVAEAKPEHSLAANQNAQQSAAGDADIQSPDALPELPTEPTAAGIPKSSPDKAVQASAAVPFTVYFKFDSSKLTPESANSANELLSAAKNCRNLIKLNGHTCNLGSDAANLQLGLTRANAVKKLLIASGIGAKAILTASEGMRKPAAPNDTKEGQALNRRVELQCVDN